MDHRPYEIIEGLENILIISFFELVKLIDSGKEFLDLVPSNDKYDPDTGELLDEPPSPNCLKFLDQFYRLSSNINTLIEIESLNNEKVEKFFKQLKENHNYGCSQQFVDKVINILKSIHKKD